MTNAHATLVLSAALAVGLIISMAGGGMLGSSPALVWPGYTQISANATHTLALAPGMEQPQFT